MIAPASIAWRSAPIWKRTYSIGCGPLGRVGLGCRLEPHARNAGGERGRNLGELVDGERRLAQRLDGLLCRFGQLDERLGDLLGTGRLRLHALVGGLEARNQRLDLM